MNMNMLKKAASIMAVVALSATGAVGLSGCSTGEPSQLVIHPPKLSA